MIHRKRRTFFYTFYILYTGLVHIQHKMFWYAQIVEKIYFHICWFKFCVSIGIIWIICISLHEICEILQVTQFSIFIMTFLKLRNLEWSREAKNVLKKKSHWTMNTVWNYLLIFPYLPSKIPYRMVQNIRLGRYNTKKIKVQNIRLEGPISDWQLVKISKKSYLLKSAFGKIMIVKINIR